MDKLLNGIVKSNNTPDVKRALIKKLKDAGSTSQSPKVVKDVLQVIMLFLTHSSHHETRHRNWPLSFT